ncbi:hypothetical protein JG559_12075 [Enterococcus faecalis]|uniref:Uncharacterized protein n=1 Tax=Enterococcus faecalis TaxID=1351 RepID=A0A974NZ40_ENTFL|nr:hypothetical protein JG559_12075 [Enterococcus faecalis]
MAKIANQRHLRAVQGWDYCDITFNYCRFFFLIIAFPPLPESWGITQFLTSNLCYNLTALPNDNVHYGVICDFWHWR